MVQDRVLAGDPHAARGTQPQPSFVHRAYGACRARFSREPVVAAITGAGRSGDLTSGLISRDAALRPARGNRRQEGRPRSVAPRASTTKASRNVLAPPYLPAKLPSPANAETAISDIAEGLGISLIRVFPYTASSQFNFDPAPAP